MTYKERLKLREKEIRQSQERQQRELFAQQRCHHCADGTTRYIKAREKDEHTVEGYYVHELVDYTGQKFEVNCTRE